MREPDWGKCKHYLKEEGMFLFGGIKDNGDISDKLYVLKIGSSENKWVEIETEGVGP